MSDWELTSASLASSNKKMTQAVQSDWALSEPQQEGFGGKLLRDIAIGMAHGGRNLHNAPHDITQAIEESTAPFGELFKSLPGSEYYAKPHAPISQYLPNDTMDYSSTFGQNAPAEFPHNYIQKGIEYAPEIIGGANALRSLKLIPHLTRYGASKKLVKAREMGKNKNIAPLEVNPDLIEDTRQFLPNTTPYRTLIDEAGYGDYNRLFDLQSDLGKHAGVLSKDWFSKANRAHGRAGLQVRGNILKEMKQSLRKEGHGDIADLLTKGQDEYRRYMKFKPYRNALGIAAGAYFMPKNALIELAQKLAFMKHD